MYIIRSLQNIDKPVAEAVGTAVVAGIVVAEIEG